MNGPTSVAEPCAVPEILAPAGGPEAFYAALRSGADAVYLGLQQFNARRRATNFSIADLRRMVPEAHSCGMKVLVTVNVLAKQDELSSLITMLADLEDVGVDAIIVQDLAVVSIARKYFPGLRLHASTQMAVHNLEGVKFAAEQGLKRIVLARELSLTELKRIRAAVPRSVAELETFCHGSLCYSYSGLCFFSGADDARSGNRGECAYTCRQPYKIVSEPGQGFLFSMKDLDSSDQMDKFISAGVDCLKIEGRKKDAQYVTSVVQMYRHRLDEAVGFSTLRPDAPSEAHAAQASFDPDRNRSDLSLSYHRRTTSLFTKGRYHENVIDLDNPTHVGLPIGEITGLVGNDRIRVKLSGAVEKYDGLKIEQADKVFHASPQDGKRVAVDQQDLQKKYENAWHQFSLRHMWIGKKSIIRGDRGQSVDIAVGTDCRPVVGQKLYKVRSVDLKQRVEKLAKPAGEKTLPWRHIDLQVALATAEDTLHISLRALRGEEEVATAQYSAAADRPRGESTLSGDLTTLLQTFGTIATAADVTIEGDDRWFVPRSFLKQIKRDFVDQLASGYECIKADKIAAAHDDLSGRAIDTNAASELAVKLDRVETWEFVLAWAKAHPGVITRIWFEPKRTFVKGVPGEILATLMQQASATNIAFGIALPTVIRAWDQPYLKKWLAAARENGVTNFEVGNVGAISWLADLGINDVELSTDFSLYALNNAASSFWGDFASLVTLSIEDDLQNLRAQLTQWRSAAKPQAILYKDTPLFIAESCSLTALHNGCPTAKVCGYRNLEVENTKGERFIVAHEACKSVVYGKEAYAISHRRKALEDLGVRNFRVDFLTRPYAAEDVRNILAAAHQGCHTDGTYEANFSRTLL